ncbi:MAG: alginate export family protein [Acidobacteriota bacterium]|nr:alginate export family protein [Acidobacteriota bacterium]
MRGSNLKPPLLAALVLLPILGSSGPLTAEDAPRNLREALARGTASLAFRYRLEQVDDSGVSSGKDASASTLRTSLGYKTAPFKGLHFFVEAENVATVGNDQLFRNVGAGSASNGVTDRPVVADPALTELNQVWIELERGETRFRAGRQEINIGDQRFVGAVGWRQNHQSFDGLKIVNGSLERVSLTYAFVDSVQRIFGDSKDMSSHLVEARFTLSDAARVTGYAYVLDYDRVADSNLSTATLGAELAGHHPLGNNRKLLYELEAARQRDAGDNPSEIEAEYFHGLLGIASARLTAKAGWERLDGSPSDGQFRTPLATLHKFNGWADKFLNTPVNGLDDIYLLLTGKAGKLGWTAVFHDFAAATGSGSYGEELDLQLTYPTACGLALGFKAALFDADSHSADTEKLMLWTTYKF